ncbi:hypothetical protein WJX77_009640, partial [Trebouxia sp. C0004]
PPFPKDAKIAIIGAGPAGLTMAYELQKRGYQKVTLYEKDVRIGGMTYTKWDTAPAVDHNILNPPEIKVVPHEMGACYLTAIRHRYILDIMEEVYLDAVPMPSMEVYSGSPGDATQHFEDWMQTQYSPLTVQLGKWLDLSDNDKATEFLGQLNKYFEQRTALLGEEGTFLFPSRRPSPDALQELGMPFKMWLEKHGLNLILPLFYETQTSQGYGYIEEVPTYYALVWNSKELFSYICLPKLDFLKLARSALEKIMDKLEFLPHRVRHQVKVETAEASVQRLQQSFRAVMVQGGFMSIWERLAKRLPNVNKSINIIKVDRHVEDPSLPISITYTEGSNKEAVTAHHDFLMLACKLDDVPWLDTQLDEADIFKSIHNYELTTTCVSIPASAANDIPTTPHMFLPEKLTSVKFLNRCYVTRTSLKCVAPGLSYGPGSFPCANGKDDRRWDQGDDTRVCFQYSAIDAAPVGSKQYKTNDELYSQLEEDLKAYGAQSVQAHMDPYDPSQRLQKRWKYMPHFLSKDLGKLWDLWELQNTHRTFYLGSITCFESTADVHSYNMQLADYYQL